MDALSERILLAAGIRGVVASDGCNQWTEPSYQSTVFVRCSKEDFLNREKPEYNRRVIPLSVRDYDLDAYSFGAWIETVQWDRDFVELVAAIFHEA